MLQTRHCEIGDLPKNLIVAWSGGLDSTYLVQEALIQGVLKGTFSVVHPQLQAIDQQKEARAAINEFLTLDKRWHREQVLSFEQLPIFSGDWPRSVTIQLLWTLIGALAVQPGDSLALGFLMSERIWAFKEEMHNIWSGCMKMLNKDCELVFPLSWMEKWQVLDGINGELYSLTWTCESPADGLACGRCGSCLNHEIGIKAHRILRPGEYVTVKTSSKK